MSSMRHRLTPRLATSELRLLAFGLVVMGMASQPGCEARWAPRLIDEVASAAAAQAALIGERMHTFPGAIRVA